MCVSTTGFTLDPKPEEPPRRKGSPGPTAEFLDAVSEAFGFYGKKVLSRGKVLQRRLRAQLREHDEATILSAVHGYQYYHRNSAQNGFDAQRNFTPDTVLRPSKFEKYVEAAMEASSEGLQPPFKPDRVLSKNEKVLRDALETPNFLDESVTPQ